MNNKLSKLDKLKQRLSEEIPVIMTIMILFPVVAITSSLPDWARLLMFLGSLFAVPFVCIKLLRWHDKYYLEDE